MIRTYTTKWGVNCRSFTEGMAALPVLGLPASRAQPSHKPNIQQSRRDLSSHSPREGLATSPRGSSLRSWAIGSDSALW